MPAEIIPSSAWVQYGLILLLLVSAGGVAKWLTWLFIEQRKERKEWADSIERERKAVLETLERTQQSQHETLERMQRAQREEREVRDSAWQAWLASESEISRKAHEGQARAHREHLERFASENRDAAKEHRVIIERESAVIIEALRSHQSFLDTHRKDARQTMELFREEIVTHLSRLAGAGDSRAQRGARNRKKEGNS